MKIRTDFVTNSSSSSFILGRKGELTDKEKEAIIEYVESMMLGEELLTPENTEEEIQKVLDEYCIDEEREEDIREALKSGQTVFYGSVIFECSDDSYAEVFSSVWNKIEEASDGNFEIIDGSLEY